MGKTLTGPIAMRTHMRVSEGSLTSVKSRLQPARLHTVRQQDTTSWTGVAAVVGLFTLSVNKSTAL
jgi:hypothetical protein